MFLTVGTVGDNKMLFASSKVGENAGNMSISISIRAPNVEQHLFKCFLHNLHQPHEKNGNFLPENLINLRLEFMQILSKFLSFTVPSFLNLA